MGAGRFEGDWGRRVWIFDKLIWTVLTYSVEIWGWAEREGIERLEEIPEIDIRGRGMDIMVYGQGRASERKVERKGGEESLGIRKEIIGVKGRRVGWRVLRGNEEKVQGGRDTNRMGEEKRDIFLGERGEEGRSGGKE